MLMNGSKVSLRRILRLKLDSKLLKKMMKIWKKMRPKPQHHDQYIDKQNNYFDRIRTVGRILKGQP